MSNNPLALLQQSGQLVVPASLQAMIPQTTQSELRENVGSSAAVLSIKGKTFGIKHGGKTDQITVVMNGQLYAAPFFDVLMIRAKGALSKTYYRSGYSDGADSQPDCWSEDGVTPLAPLDQRPKLDDQITPCSDCRLCPMNRFGSRVTENGSKGKACADTRKVAILPVDPATQQVDFDNDKYNGPMLMRVPAASLGAFRDYDTALAQQGLPYYFAVTRLQFDPAQAYPKFVLQAVRVLNDAEGQRVLALRDDIRVNDMLDAGQAGTAPPAPQLAAPVQAAPALTAPAQSVDALLAGGGAPAPVIAPAPLQPAPVAAVAPVMAPAPNNVVPLQPAPLQQAPVQAAPVVAPVPVAAPAPVAPAPAPVVAAPPPAATAPAPADPLDVGWPAGYQRGPSAQYSYASYKAGNWTDQQILDAQAMVPAQAVAAAPIAPAALVAATGELPKQSAPVPTPGLMASVDSLLNQ